MSHCLCSGLVEVISIAQAQYMNHRKYTNSYTVIDECRQLSVQILLCKGNEISFPHVNWYTSFFKSCDLSFSTCFLKVCSIDGTEVVLKTRITLFFLGIIGIVIDCVIEFDRYSISVKLIGIVLRSTGRGSVNSGPTCTTLEDGSISSRIATDYHTISDLDYTPLSVVSGVGGYCTRVE
jgi:hypothetical protein